MPVPRRATLLQSKVARHGSPDHHISDVETPRRAARRHPAVLGRRDGAGAVFRVDRAARGPDGAGFAEVTVPKWLPTASGRLRSWHVRGDQRRLQGRIGKDRSVGDEVRSHVTDTSLRRSGDDDLAVAAGDDLPVDEDVLAIVDRDGVTVGVGVGAPAAGTSGLCCRWRGRSRGPSTAMARAPKSVAAYWKRVSLRVVDVFMSISLTFAGPAWTAFVS